MDLATIEAALASGNLWAAMRNGRYWKVRRNGGTQTWKRDAARFRIPVKAGLKSCGEVTNLSSVSADGSTMPDFLISETDPNVRAHGNV